MYDALHNVLRAVRPHALWTAIVILVATSALKLVSLVAGRSTADGQDPLLLLSNQTVLLLSSAVEVGVVVGLLAIRTWSVRGAIIVLLGLEFVLYHVMLRWYGGNCACVGNLWHWVRVSHSTASKCSVFLTWGLCVLGMIVLLSTVERTPDGARGRRRPS